MPLHPILPTARRRTAPPDRANAYKKFNDALKAAEQAVYAQNQQEKTIKRAQLSVVLDAEIQLDLLPQTNACWLPTDGSPLVCSITHENIDPYQERFAIVGLRGSRTSASPDSGQLQLLLNGTYYQCQVYTVKGFTNHLNYRGRGPCVDPNTGRTLSDNTIDKVLLASPLTETNTVHLKRWTLPERGEALHPNLPEHWEIRQQVFGFWACVRHSLTLRSFDAREGHDDPA